MTEESRTNILQNSRLLVLGLVAVIIILGLALVVMAIGGGATPQADEPVNALANSNDECVVCHERNTPGIVQQYGHSTMAAADVSCSDCHEVDADYPGAIEHEGTHVLNTPTTAMCQTCHETEVAQYNQSRHGLPAYVAYAGATELSDELLAQYENIPEGSFNPDRSRNAIHALEGPDVTRFTCEGCHDIGKPAADGSVGECQQCHLRHEFSLEQARRPETCNACHIGPDHPQYEIYVSSPHGIAYTTGSDDWNWDADPGTLTVEDFPAPTCAVCHISGFGGTGTTHDVGDRLTWYLFAPVSERRPAWQDNKGRMVSVCTECHNPNFIADFYDDGDKLVAAINDWVLESREIIKPAQDAGLLTDAPFDQPIDFTFFDLWHHWGRTAKFGAWMQSPDYSQWHGAYEVLRELAVLQHEVDILLEEAEATE
ncbi:MAG: nitrate reductase [Chloroflexi bacterium]|nr:MAG: nitrate reductase [Chloroflexota bacterium]MBL1195213.1 nitrate reductase [Chloroflexota bacterium]NOH12498.1 nitrate reductase [Chloroflexota bacterium]